MTPEQFTFIIARDAGPYMALDGLPFVNPHWFAKRYSRLVARTLRWRGPEGVADAVDRAFQKSAIGPRFPPLRCPAGEGRDGLACLRSPDEIGVRT